MSIDPVALEDALMRDDKRLRAGTPEWCLWAINRIDKLEVELDALREDKQITLRDLMAMQVYQAVATEGAGTIGQAAKELGIEILEYDFDKHWNKLVALRCYRVADAFLEARTIDAAKGNRP